MEGVLALVRLYQQFKFALNDERHGSRPLEHESLITLMPKVIDCMLPHGHLLIAAAAAHLYSYGARSQVWLETFGSLVAPTMWLWDASMLTLLCAWHRCTVPVACITHLLLALHI